MILYILKASFCLALLLAVYHLFLEKEKMHQFNRFYLLGSILFSFYAPSFIIYTEPIIINETIVPIVTSTLELNNTNNTISTLITTPKNHIDFKLVFFVIYALISFVFLFRFCKNLLQIVYKIRNNKKSTYKNATIVLITEKIIPHTFLHYIFINKKDFKKNAVEDALFTHELTHVTQKHTFDILLVELLQIFCWFNPIIVYLKKAIKLNHEFIADDSVLHSHKNTSAYQQLLLNKAALKNNSYLASNFNYSLTKKRLIMMTKQSSQLKMLFKKIAVFPMAITLLFLFATRVEAQNKETKIPPPPPPSNKVNDTVQLYKEYYYKNQSFVMKDKNGNKTTKSYAELTNEEKNRLIPPPPLVSIKKTPSQQLIEDLKDATKYAVWIDGKVINNTVLNNYTSSYFSDFFVSFVYKNARSERFPQEHQANLYTHEHFKQQNIESIKKWRNYMMENNIPPPPPTNKIKSQDYKNNPPPPVMDTIYTYTNLAKRIVTISANRKANIIYLKKLYGNMNNSQKSKVDAPEIILKSIELNSFKISIAKTDNGIKLKCIEGCAWKELTFNIDTSKSQTIDEYGMTELNKISKIKDSNLADFSFTLTKTENGISLKGIEGTAWSQLNFSLEKNSQQSINQLGMIDLN